MALKFKMMQKIQFPSKIMGILASKQEQEVHSSEYIKVLHGSLVQYFEHDKPYLDPDLTIMQVSRSLGTNKSYVARAIKLFEKVNYCTFVNHKRIEHALNEFRKRPDLRVNELAYMSGFNSSSAFTIAFKKEFGVPPGEWCRNYRMDIQIKKCHR